jgi:hypothetical protein
MIWLIVYIIGIFTIGPLLLFISFDKKRCEEIINSADFSDKFLVIFYCLLWFPGLLFIIFGYLFYILGKILYFIILFPVKTLYNLTK